MWNERGGVWTRIEAGNNSFWGEEASLHHSLSGEIEEKVLLLQLLTVVTV